MDSAPQSHPILSYMLSCLPTLSNPRPASGGGDFDIEQPHVQTPSPRTPSSADEFDLIERMPGLRHPSVLRAIADVSAARSALQLQLLGPHPDHELVDSSRALITVAAASDSQIPEGDLEVCRVVVRLEETHDAYEALLQEAEGRLERVYRSAMQGRDLEEAEGKEESSATAGAEVGDATVQEEVFAVLKQAEEGKAMESVRLMDRQLCHLPEAFGRIQGLRVLDVSCNQLEWVMFPFSKNDSFDPYQELMKILIGFIDVAGLYFALTQLTHRNISQNHKFQAVGLGNYLVVLIHFLI